MCSYQKSVFLSWNSDKTWDFAAFLWTHEPLIYKRLMSKVCDNVRHYDTTAIQWIFNVKVLYWWRLTTKKLKRFVCKDYLYSILLINHCMKDSAIIWYEHIII